MSDDDFTPLLGRSDEMVPAFQSRFSPLSKLGMLKERCGGLCSELEAEWGAQDHKYVDMMFTLRELTADDLPHSWVVASAFLAWARRYPELVGQVEMTPCRCSHGWVLVEDDKNVWRPCSRCNRETYERVYHVNSEEPGERAAEDRSGVAPTPPWDSYDAKPEF